MNQLEKGIKVEGTICYTRLSVTNYIAMANLFPVYHSNLVPPAYSSFLQYSIPGKSLKE